MAWFPADTPVTPRASAAASRSSITLSAPRGLKLPVRWKSSSFSHTPVCSPTASRDGFVEQTGEPAW